MNKQSIIYLPVLSNTLYLKTSTLGQEYPCCKGGYSTSLNKDILSL